MYNGGAGAIFCCCKCTLEKDQSSRKKGQHPRPPVTPPPKKNMPTYPVNASGSYKGKTAKNCISIW